MLWPERVNIARPERLPVTRFGCVICFNLNSQVDNIMSSQVEISEAEIDAYFEDLESEAWNRDCKNMDRAQDSAADYKAWLADDSYLKGII